jgi:hypothetical protein
VVVDDALTLLHEVNTLCDRPSVPTERKVEPSLAELELQEAFAAALQVAELELNP